MTTKGYHYEKNQVIPEGERKLYIVIEGPTELSVKRAKVCHPCPFFLGRAHLYCFCFETHLLMHAEAHSLGWTTSLLG